MWLAGRFLHPTGGCGRSRDFPSSVPLRGFLREHVQTSATSLGLGHVLAAREAALPFPGDGNAARGGCAEIREARPGWASIVRRPAPAAVLGTQFLSGRRCIRGTGLAGRRAGVMAPGCVLRGRAG
jgi:hypothetical protein